MKLTSLTVDVKLTVDRNTAETCLKMVELYVNETGNEVVIGYQEDGTLTYSLLGADTRGDEK